MDKQTYLNILVDTLIRKNDILDHLIHITLKQDENIITDPSDLDRIEQSVKDKSVLIEELNKLDLGFDKIYEHVKDEISIRKIDHKDTIIRLQNLIKDVTNKSVKLQTLEQRNQINLNAYISAEKKKIKEYKLNNQTVSSYYKNMMNQHQGHSYFLDKKK